MGLAPYQDRPVQALSGGLKQRLALALARMGDPPLLLLDEPTANLDMAARLEWMRQLQALKAQGKTLIFSSHRLEEILELADRVVVLREGQVVAEVAPEALARTVGLQARLRLSLPPAEQDRARRLLEEAGYPVVANHHGLTLTVPADQKLAPVRQLWAAGIPVQDAEWELSEP
jgi:ABC-type multidrug transport system ATPase subunit